MNNTGTLIQCHLSREKLHIIRYREGVRKGLERSDERAKEGEEETFFVMSNDLKKPIFINPLVNLKEGKYKLKLKLKATSGGDDGGG